MKYHEKVILTIVCSGSPVKVFVTSFEAKLQYPPKILLFAVPHDE